MQVKKLSLKKQLTHKKETQFNHKSLLCSVVFSLKNMTKQQPYTICHKFIEQMHLVPDYTCILD